MKTGRFSSTTLAAIVSCIAITPAFSTAEQDRDHGEPPGLSEWEPQILLRTLKNLPEEWLR